MFIGTLCTGNGPGLHWHKLSYDSQSVQPITENYRTVSKRATTTTDGTPVTLNVTNFQSIWMQRHKQRRIYALWGKMLQTSMTDNVTGHGMHAQFSFL